MPKPYFPLRWESTGDQWWYASPIDWAAANGHYDLVRQLLHLDANLLIKLSSLRHIRRLETVWDDDAQFADIAKNRSFVAQNLFHECDRKNKKNTLVRAGYGGWLLCTAASAGDVSFVRELLERDPWWCLVKESMVSLISFMLRRGARIQRFVGCCLILQCHLNLPLAEAAVAATLVVVLEDLILALGGRW